MFHGSTVLWSNSGSRYERMQIQNEVMNMAEDEEKERCGRSAMAAPTAEEAGLHPDDDGCVGREDTGRDVIEIDDEESDQHRSDDDDDDGEEAVDEVEVDAVSGVHVGWADYSSLT